MAHDCMSWCPTSCAQHVSVNIRELVLRSRPTSRPTSRTRARLVGAGPYTCSMTINTDVDPGLRKRIETEAVDRLAERVEHKLGNDRAAGSACGASPARSGS